MKKSSKLPVKESEDVFEECNIYKSLLNNTADLVWSVDTNFNLVTSNPAFDQKIKSKSGKRLSIGSNVLTTQLHFITLCERAFLGETFTETIYTEQPVELWSELSCYPIRKGTEVVGATCYLHDVTSSNLQQKHLRLLESVVTHASDAVLITEVNPFDESGPKIVYVNDALTKMTGYTREEIIGKTPRILYGPKSDKDQLIYLRNCFEKSIAGEIEIINYKKDGGEFWIHLALAPVADSAGKYTHFVAVGRDVTERLKNIQAIRDQNKQLREIAWIQSHAVRGPLARIMGIVNLLSINPLLADESVKELFDHLQDSTNEMDSVIKSIVDQAGEATIA